MATYWMEGRRGPRYSGFATAKAIAAVSIPTAKPEADSPSAAPLAMVSDALAAGVILH